MFVPSEELDVGLCVSSGQVFRWKKTEGGWSGADGTNRIDAFEKPGGWEILSLPDETAFNRYFRLDRSLIEISAEILKLGPELRPYIESHPGLRVLKPEFAHETLFSFLCTPNNHLSRITKMVEYLGSLGRQIEKGHFEFPSVEKLASLTEVELREKGFGYRAKTIMNIAQEIQRRNPNWVTNLRTLSYEDAHRELCGLNGIGPKVADCICLFGTYHEEAVPIDTHLWQAACDVYFPKWKGTDLTSKKYQAVGNHFRERFGKLAGWAHQYLFYSRILGYRKGTPPVYSSP